jgi:hypothetical protein
MVTNLERKSLSSSGFQRLLRRLAPLTLLIHFQAFWNPLRGELPRVQIFMIDGSNPLTWDAKLLSYWFSRNPAGGLPRLALEFYQIPQGLPLFWVVRYKAHMMAHIFLMFLSEWHEFTSASCLAEKKTLWHLASRCCLNHALRLTCFLSASVRRKYLNFGTSFQRHYRFRPPTSGNRSV